MNQLAVFLDQMELSKNGNQNVMWNQQKLQKDILGGLVKGEL